MAGVEEFFFGLDVDEDLGYAVDGAEDSIFNAVGDGVAGTDGDVAIDDDVEVDVVAEADFTHETFFQTNDTGHQFGDLADVLLDFGGRGGVEDLGKGSLELAPGAEEDDGGSEEGGPVVHAGVAGEKRQ